MVDGAIVPATRDGATDAPADATTLDVTPDATPPLAELEDAPRSVVVGEARIVSVTVTPRGAIADAEAAVARGRFRFRSCVRSQDAGPSEVMLKIKVGEGGEVVSVVTPSEGAPTKDGASSGPSKGAPAPATSEASCLRLTAGKLAFAEPTGGSATVDVTVRLTR